MQQLSKNLYQNQKYFSLLFVHGYISIKRKKMGEEQYRVTVFLNN